MTSRIGIATILIAWLLTSPLSGAAPDVGLAAQGGGLAVLVNPPTAEAIAELQLSARFTVHCLTDNKTLVADLRDAEDGRVSVEHWRLGQLPFADNLVNLMIVYKGDSTQANEIQRVLVPLGSAWVRNGRQADLNEAGLEIQGETKSGWLGLRKAWPDEIDEWTHFMHGADGNGVANDTRIGSPRSMQWTAGPDWTQHHNRPNSMSAMVSARGRLYYINNDAPPSAEGLPDRWSLIARDAFNGVVLWRKPIANWGWKAWSDDPVSGHGRFTQPPHIARTLVADGNAVYVTLGFGAAVSAIDGRTGEVIRTYGGTENTDEILFAAGRLYLAVHDQSLEERSASAKSARRGGRDLRLDTKRVLAVDAASGKILWESRSHVGISEKQQFMEIHRHLNPVFGDGKIFFATRAELVCLNAETGQQVWRRPRPASEEHLMRYAMRASDMVTLVYHSGRVFFSQLEPTERIGWRDVKATLHAFSATDGGSLWNRSCASWGWGSPADVLISQGLVWVHEFKTATVLGLDLDTGQVVRTTSNKVAFDNGHHHRCYRNKATSKFLLTSYRGVELIDWNDQGKTSLNHWFRAACRYGLLPANGLIYNSPNPCSCYIDSKLNGFNAVSSSLRTGRVADVDRLTEGPAFRDAARSSSSMPSSSSADWPAFRHDTRRTCQAGAGLTAALTKAWTLDLGGVPTAPIVVDNLVHVAVPKTRQLIAVSAVSGEKRWSVTTLGQIDTPPTWHQGTVVYGTRDGYVACRRASDGVLVWRFLAAPSQRRVMANGQLESSWPVHGSVVIEGGKVYAIAGRSSFLDGGFTGWVLDAKSGKVIKQTVLDAESETAAVTKIGTRVAPGMTNDLLVGDGASLYLRGRQVFGNISTEEATPLLRPVAGFLDHTWFNRVSQWKYGANACGEGAIIADDLLFSFSAFRRRGTDSGFFKPGTSTYALNARAVVERDVVDRKGKKRGAKKTLQAKWTQKIQTAARAMLHAGEVVVVGGSPDVVDRDDPWKQIEGRGRGLLVIVSGADGQLLAELPLESPPVFDGMATARGQLFVSSQSGTLTCLKSKQADSEGSSE